jgi:hypothetical protein
MGQRGAAESKMGSTWRVGLKAMVKRATVVAEAARSRGQWGAGRGDRGGERWNRRSWSFAEGGRGIQAANFCSEGFGLFMVDSLELGLKPGKSIAVTTSNGIWRNTEVQADLLESMLVPDFKDDHFALFSGESGERAHGGGFGGLPGRGRFEPASGFEFTGQAPPDTAAIVQGAVAKAAEAIVFGLIGWTRGTEECHESFVEDIFGFVVAEAESPAVEDEQSGLGVIKLLTPAMVIVGLAHPWFSARIDSHPHLR